jgi:2-polyprenyl-6-methoxyphenol hydroxylase-like FAD-dependent oxidoreductase
VLDSGAPAIRQVTRTAAGESVTRAIKHKAGVDLLVAPRRYILDTIVAEAAAAAGADLRLAVTVDGVRLDDTGRAIGVYGHGATSRPLEIDARYVVGADGVRSRVARSVGAPLIEDRGAAGATQYAYFRGLPDPRRIAAFWALALGYVDEPGYDEVDGVSIIDPDGKGPAIGFLKEPEPKTAKNRIHIDIRVAGEPPWDMTEREQLIRAKVGELLAAGATAVREVSHDGRLGHVVMLDPERNEFCVA